MSNVETIEKELARLRKKLEEATTDDAKTAYRQMIKNREQMINASAPSEKKSKKHKRGADYE